MCVQFIYVTHNNGQVVTTNPESPIDMVGRRDHRGQKRREIFTAREQWFPCYGLSRVEKMAGDDVFIFKRPPDESPVRCLVEVLAGLHVRSEEKKYELK